jgi:ParB-like chromosome segregation protein Spo0J
VVDGEILGEIQQVRVHELDNFPGNARRGDVDAIAKSLETFGQFQPIIAQLSTKFVLVGNHTLAAARQLRWAHISVAYVDVDDEMARKIVLAANRTSDLATYDLDALAALLREVDDLEGTGFSPDDLSELMEDEPEVEEKERASSKQLGVVVYTDTVERQMELMATLLEEGWEARAL